MTTEFQKNLLRYLLQNRDGNQYFPYLDGNLFDLAIHKIAFDILSGYYKKYGQLPTPVSASQLLEDELGQTDSLPEGLAEELQAFFKECQVPLSGNDQKFIADQLIQSVQNKTADRLILDYSDQKLSIDQLSSKLGQVSLLTKGGDIQNTKGFLVQDRHHHFDDGIEGAPTFLQDLNSMTAARGFYSPQLIIFMSGPKNFKTGLIIKLGIEYARDGYRVYYADAENGLRAIRNRAKMAIMECTLDELYDSNNADEVDITMENFYRFMGGDIFVDYYPAGTATVGDVRNRLYMIREKHNWVPEIIIWDSIDHFLPTNLIDQRKETRLQIQRVYHEVIALNSELGAFAIAPSQVNRKAISKKVFDMQDVAEDFGKMMNAHGVFAICATPEELEQKIRRIIPVAQREGSRYTGTNQCIVMVDEERMVMQEVDKEAYLKNITDD